MNTSLGRRCGPLPRLISGTVGALALLLGTPWSARALTITPFFSTSVTLGQQAVINNAITFYQNTFADPITVKISFNADGACGLGCSTTGYTKQTYATYRTKLGLDGTSPDDATALANTPVAPTNPVNGTTAINLTTANARAVGIAVGGFVTGCTANDCDGAVRFNPGLVTLTPPTAGLYSLFAVIEHEVDEVLGTASGVGGTGFFSDPRADDLFRWASPGVRAFTTACPTNHPYFSIDGGVTNLDPFNCDGVGDYGDWASTGTPQVQDAYGTPGANPTLAVTSPEVRTLDVVGYTLTTQTTTPEPSTLFLLGTGLSGLIGIGFQRQRRSDG